jgi:hypothetical protein
MKGWIGLRWLMTASDALQDREFVDNMNDLELLSKNPASWR